MTRRALVPLLLVLGTLAAGCGAGRTAQTTTSTAPTPPQQKQPVTVWLCYPGRSPDPCETSLDTTVVRADGTRAVEHVAAAAHPAIDCFYVYPTVSNEPRGNSDLKVQLPETLVAQVQAARFSQVCRVYAPMYRQITDKGLTTPSLHADPYLAYGDVLSAWRDYLAHDNHGRGVVLIGHSQGAYVLKHLVKTVIDRSQSERRLLVSAILLGGQVLAANGPGDHGDFVHVPPCATTTSTGCVVAYSSFDRVPPPNARFGRDASTATHVLCVNPAAPAGGTAPVLPLFPASVVQLAGGTLGFTPTTTWVAFPDLYTARCERSGTASWLQITRTKIPGDHRPVVGPLFGAGWGLHATDVNIALGNLVQLVADQARAFAKLG